MAILGFLDLMKQPLRGFRDQYVRPVLFPAFKAADRLRHIVQVARIAGPRGSAAVVILGKHVVDCGRRKVEPSLLAHDLEDLRIHLARRRVDADFVADPPHEGVIHQILRIQVRRKDDELLERQLKLAPVTSVR